MQTSSMCTNLSSVDAVGSQWLHPPALTCPHRLATASKPQACPLEMGWCQHQTLLEGARSAAAV